MNDLKKNSSAPYSAKIKSRRWTLPKRHASWRLSMSKTKSFLSTIKLWEMTCKSKMKRLESLFRSSSIIHHSCTILKTNWIKQKQSYTIRVKYLVPYLLDRGDAQETVLLVHHLDQQIKTSMEWCMLVKTEFPSRSLIRKSSTSIRSLTLRASFLIL